MLFFEVFAPKGALGAERRRAIGRRLIDEVVNTDSTDPAAIETARAMRTLTWAVFHEVETWIAGEGDGDAPERPRYLVRVLVTPGPLSEAKRAHVVEAVTRALAEGEDAAERLYAEPRAWVHLVEVPSGAWGACGKVMPFEDIAGLIQETRAGLAEPLAAER